MKRVMLGAMLLLGAVVLAACGDDDEDPTATATASEPAEQRSVTLMLNWTPNNHHAGIYAAHRQGWYEEAGIDLEIVEPAAAGADAVVGAGTAQFGISQAESLLPARLAGADIVSIATLLPHNDSSLMALASEGIERPRDFEGKTYGGFGGTLERELIDTLVACDGGDPSLVNFVEVGNIDYLGGMDQDRFDFVWVFEGWDALRAREVEGIDLSSVLFIDYTDCIPDWYTPIVITNADLIESDPELVRDFLEVTTRGYEYAIAEPAETAALLLAAAPELDEALVGASADYHASRYADDGEGWGVQSGDVWERFEEFLREAGLIEEPVDVSEAFTNEFLPS